MGNEVAALAPGDTRSVEDLVPNVQFREVATIESRVNRALGPMLSMELNNKTLRVGHKVAIVSKTERKLVYNLFSNRKKSRLLENAFRGLI